MVARATVALPAAFCRPDRPSHLLDRLQVPLAVLLHCLLPGRLEETQQMPRAEASATLFSEQLEIRRVIVVAPGRDLVVAVLVQFPERLGHGLLRVELRVVIPVTLDHRLRHLPVKQLRVVPDIVRPDPRTRAALLDLRDQEQEVAPPRVILADDNVLVILLVPVILLVHSQVEEPGSSRW